jgi:hypothetical protein
MQPGTRVEVAMTKWRDLPHWEYSAFFLGSDLYGDWIGMPAGTPMARPGADYVAPVDQVGLVPPEHAGERGWLATFHARGGEVDVYVDITAPPTWDGPTVTACDLDLDVVRELDGRVWVDDEDEFAEHQVSLRYPADVIESARASCDRLVALVGGGHPPYDGSAGPWFDVLHRWSRKADQ